MLTKSMQKLSLEVVQVFTNSGVNTHKKKHENEYVPVIVEDVVDMYRLNWFPVGNRK